MRISILGFGLIGGSLAQAIRRESPSAGLGATATIGAWSPTGRGPARGLEEGAIDQVFASVDEAIDGADLIVLAGPPLACLELIQVIGRWPAARLGDTATITDVASTKSLLVAAADRGGLRFVGGHPMAGRETTGYESASAELFEGRPWVVVPGRHARPVDIDRVERLARAAGARPLQMNALDHDAAVAAISHLPLVVSAALVEAVVGGGTQRLDWPAAERLAASGWQGMTRLARGEVEMGVGIAATNAGSAGGARCLVGGPRGGGGGWSKGVGRGHGKCATRSGWHGRGGRQGDGGRHDGGGRRG
jgi:prephenate dehydrogenase